MRDPEGGLTLRAADKWDSARYSSLFLALGLYCPQAESRPAHLQLTQGRWAAELGQMFQKY